MNKHLHSEDPQLRSSASIEEGIAKYMHGREVDVYSADLRRTRVGILRKIYGEYDEHGFQVWYLYDSNFSRAEGTATFSAHDVEHLGAHYSSITLREVKR